MMNPEWKKKWIEALRSGKYEQGMRALKRNYNGTPQFCCLGVLCDLVDPEGWTPPDRAENVLIAAELFRYKGAGATTNLPLPVCQLTGVEGLLGRLPLGAGYCDLAAANDGGLTFETIAGFIEKHF